MSSAPSRPNVYDPDCPTRRALDLIADKWTALIVSLLGVFQAGGAYLPLDPEYPEARLGFMLGDARAAVVIISQKVLTERLRDLERDGLVWRRVYDSVPPSVEYGLTPLGVTLHEPLDAVAHWAERHIRGIASARRSYARRTVPNGAKRPLSIGRVAVVRASKDAR